MMKKFDILFVLAAILCLASCNENYDMDNGGSDSGKPVKIALSFGTSDAFDITVDTRATLSDDIERKIHNMYLVIFDAAGNKIYGKLFDSNNLNATDQPDYWTASGTYDSGTLHITTMAKTGCNIYGITNVSADIVNISAERIQLVQTERELADMVLSMNQRIVARTGLFPMSGVLENVSTDALAGKKLMLKRVDAKIVFDVNIGTAADGKPQPQEFYPETWQVVNVPSASYLIEGASDAGSTLQATLTAEERVKAFFFDTDEFNFEESSTTGGGFSFYMMENRHTSTSLPASQADRSKQVKNSDGTNGGWVYASPHSTYVVMTGRLVLNQPIEDGAQLLDADVRYVVHLGDFGTSLDDYKTNRNTVYTYNVTIRGVEDIRVEVSTSGTTNTENAPGATGDVKVAKEGLFDCDAHYSSHVLKFHYANMDDENVSWYVKTPFCEGAPVVINGVDIPDGLDYEWVHFMLNEVEDGKFKTARRIYHPDSCMNVIQLCEMLREQKAARDKGEENIFDANATADGGPRIVVTAFVDEYYYEQHPITGQVDGDLWKQFVNKPKRLMHILSNVSESTDTESHTVLSSVTIQQTSIQTIYNVENPDLHSAWGCEFVDETEGEWPYSDTGWSTDERRGNTSEINGRLNSAREWGVVQPDGIVFDETQRWSDFVNLEADASENVEMNDEYKYLRYACMLRNRDNNGDGVINGDEVRWYMAARYQLLGLWIGQDGISNSARLYKKTGTETGVNWHEFIVSSTAWGGGNSNNPWVLWAEEGSSTSALDGLVSWINLGTEDDYDVTLFSARCVRNVGYDPTNDCDISYSPMDAVPHDYLTLEGNGETGWVFNLTYLNNKSVRYYTSNELVLADENSMQNRVYKSFEVAAYSLNPTFDYISLSAINNELSTNIMNNRFCPPGYRLPNQRELSLMGTYIGGLGGVYYPTRTYYSLGTLGSGISSSWGYYWDGNVRMGNGGFTTARCVRDIQQ